MVGKKKKKKKEKPAHKKPEETGSLDMAGSGEMNLLDDDNPLAELEELSKQKGIKK